MNNLKVKNIVIFIPLLIFFYGCKYHEYTYEKEYNEVKYLQKFINRKMGGFNNKLKQNYTKISCKPMKVLMNDVNGMIYTVNDSILIYVSFDRRVDIGLDSVKKINCNNMKSIENVRIQSIEIRNLNTSGVVEFY